MIATVAICALPVLLYAAMVAGHKLGYGSPSSPFEERKNQLQRDLRRARVRRVFRG